MEDRYRENNKKVKIMFLPYAGASVYNYIQWKNKFPENMEVCFIEFPGRGRRINETCYISVKEAVNDVYKKLREIVKNDDYYIFGHSMGALIAFELYYKIKNEGFKLPKHIIFSGRNSPDAFMKLDSISDLDDISFLNRAKIFGGIPKELYYNKELREIFVPVLKADFNIIEKYKYIEHNSLIDCDMTILYSEKDLTVSKKGIESWRHHAGKNISFVQFPGGHFSCMEDEISKYIIERIASL